MEKFILTASSVKIIPPMIQPLTNCFLLVASQIIGHNTPVTPMILKAEYIIEDHNQLDFIGKEDSLNCAILIPLFDMSTIKPNVIKIREDRGTIIELAVIIPLVE